MNNIEIKGIEDAKTKEEIIQKILNIHPMSEPSSILLGTITSKKGAELGMRLSNFTTGFAEVSEVVACSNKNLHDCLTLGEFLFCKVEKLRTEHDQALNRIEHKENLIVDIRPSKVNENIKADQLVVGQLMQGIIKEDYQNKDLEEEVEVDLQIKDVVAKIKIKEIIDRSTYKNFMLFNIEHIELHQTQFLIKLNKTINSKALDIIQCGQLIDCEIEKNDTINHHYELRMNKASEKKLIMKYYNSQDKECTKNNKITCRIINVNRKTIQVCSLSNIVKLEKPIKLSQEKEIMEKYQIVGIYQEGLLIKTTTEEFFYGFVTYRDLGSKNEGSGSIELKLDAQLKVVKMWEFGDIRRYTCLEHVKPGQKKLLNEHSEPQPTFTRDLGPQQNLSDIQLGKINNMENRGIDIGDLIEGKVLRTICQEDRTVEYLEVEITNKAGIMGRVYKPQITASDPIEINTTRVFRVIGFVDDVTLELAYRKEYLCDSRVSMMDYNELDFYKSGAIVFAVVIDSENQLVYIDANNKKVKIIDLNNKKTNDIVKIQILDKVKNNIEILSAKSKIDYCHYPSIYLKPGSQLGEDFIKNSDFRMFGYYKFGIYFTTFLGGPKTAMPISVPLHYTVSSTNRKLMQFNLFNTYHIGQSLSTLNNRCILDNRSLVIDECINSAVCSTINICKCIEVDYETGVYVERYTLVDEHNSLLVDETFIPIQNIKIPLSLINLNQMIVLDKDDNSQFYINGSPSNKIATDSIECLRIQTLSNILPNIETLTVTDIKITNHESMYCDIFGLNSIFEYGIIISNVPQSTSLCSIVGYDYHLNRWLLVGGDLSITGEEVNPKTIKAKLIYVLSDYLILEHENKIIFCYSFNTTFNNVKATHGLYLKVKIIRKSTIKNQINIYIARLKTKNRSKLFIQPQNENQTLDLFYNDANFLYKDQRIESVVTKISKKQLILKLKNMNDNIIGLMDKEENNLYHEGQILNLYVNQIHFDTRIVHMKSTVSTQPNNMFKTTGLVIEINDQEISLKLENIPFIGKLKDCDSIANFKLFQVLNVKIDSVDYSTNLATCSLLLDNNNQLTSNKHFRLD